MISTTARWTISIGLAALSGAACWREAVSGYAQSLAAHRTAERLSRAVALSPADADLYHQLGLALIPRDLAASSQAFRQAVTLNPYDAEALVALGMAAESAGDLRGAEQSYTRATLASQRFRPHWVLASYYYRRGDIDRFWRAARSAANIGSADARHIFELAQAVESDPDVVLQRLDFRTDNRRLAYLEYLLHATAAGGVAQTSLQVLANPRSYELLLAACERLLAYSLTGDALAVWNSLVRASLTNGPVLSPEQGVSLCNGHFRRSPQRGFDWRLSSVDGADVALVQGGARVELSGHQPEVTSLVQQTLPVLPGRRYRVSFQYSSPDLGRNAGVGWHVFPAWSNKELAPGQGALAGEGSGEFEFQTPEYVDAVRLVLMYQRQPGTVRPAATVTLTEVTLQLLNEQT